MAPRQGAGPGLRKSQFRHAKINIDDVRDALDEVYVELAALSDLKQGQSYALRGAASAGGFAAAAGTLASRAGLQNTGLGVLAAALGLDQFYAPAQTGAVHLKGMRLISCFRTSLMSVSADDIHKLLDVTPDKSVEGEISAAKVQARSLPNVAVAHVERGLLIYREAIFDQAAVVVTREDFQRFAEKAVEGQSQVSNLVSAGSPSADQAEANAIAASVLQASVNLEACTKSPF